MKHLNPLSPNADRLRNDLAGCTRLFALIETILAETSRGIESAVADVCSKLGELERRETTPSPISALVTRMQFQDAAAQRIDHAIKALAEARESLQQYVAPTDRTDMGNVWASRLSRLADAAEHISLTDRSADTEADVTLF